MTFYGIWHSIVANEEECNMIQLLKSVLEQDRAPIVLCNIDHTIVYMNRAAIQRYAKRGGDKLIGQCLLDCHNPHSNEMIKKVVAWFLEDEKNNMIFTYHNDKENKDVYMVALRDDNNTLIGYYEKQEYREAEKVQVYDFSQSLI